MGKHLSPWYVTQNRIGVVDNSEALNARLCVLALQLACRRTLLCIRHESREFLSARALSKGGCGFACRTTEGFHWSVLTSMHKANFSIGPHSKLSSSRFALTNLPEAFLSPLRLSSRCRTCLMYCVLDKHCTAYMSSLFS